MQTFNVTGMTCGHCERAVINAINTREPTAVVRVDRAADGAAGLTVGSVTG